jgi:hypothetical protein
MMLKPSRQVVATYHIPKEVINEAYTRNPAARQRAVESLVKVRSLCEELGLLRRPFGTLWRALHLA